MNELKRKNFVYEMFGLNWWTKEYWIEDDQWHDISNPDWDDFSHGRNLSIDTDSNE